MKSTLLSVDKLRAVPPAWLEPVAHAEAELIDAQARVEDAEAEAQARWHGLLALRKHHKEIELRLTRCLRDFDAEAQAHEATIMELYGQHGPGLSPLDRSRLDNAIFALAHAPALKRLLPKLRKSLEAELAKVSEELAQAEPAAEIAAASVEESELV